VGEREQKHQDVKHVVQPEQGHNEQSLPLWTHPLQRFTIHRAHFPLKDGHTSGEVHQTLLAQCHTTVVVVWELFLCAMLLCLQVLLLILLSDLV
jgi:hypothetical protein